MTAAANPVRRALGWIGGGVFAAAVLQYLLFFAAARYLGASEYGVFSLALAMAILLAPLCDLGTSVALVCTGAQRPAELRLAFGASLLLRCCLLIPVGLLGLAIGLAAGYGQGYLELFPLLFVAAVADGTGNLGAAACQASERMATSALLQVARNLLRGAALLVTLAAGGDAQTLAWYFCLASVIGAVISVHFANASAGLLLSWRHVLPTLRLALPFGATVFATILHANVDVALLGLFADADEVGRYHAAARFLLLLQMLPQIVAVATAPLSFRTGMLGVAASAQIFRVKLTALGLLGALCAIALAAHGEWLVATLLGAGFAGSEPLLLLLAPVVFVKFLASAHGSTLSALARQGRHGLGCWLALAVNILIGLCCMPSLGAYGAVLATVVSELFFLLFLAANLAGTGLELAWRQLLRHPLCMALSAAVAALLFGPVTALLAAVLTTMALLWRRPNEEELLLLRQSLPARRGVAA